MWKLKGIIAISCFCLTAGCSSKAATIEQATVETVPFKVEEIIHTENLTDGAIILYTTKQTHEGKPFEALSTAYLEGSTQSGWRNEGDNQWTYKPSAPLNVYYNDIYDYADTGELLSRFELTYGEVENENIVTVEASEDGKTFEVLDLIDKKSGTYFFGMREYKIVRGLDEKKQVVAEFKQRQQ